MYDITDIDSFAKMSMWVKELRQQCGSKLPIVIVGNKMDLEANRQIKLADAEDYAKDLGVNHYSASARTGQNVKEIFKALTERKYIDKNLILFSQALCWARQQTNRIKTRDA